MNLKEIFIDTMRQTTQIFTKLCGPTMLQLATYMHRVVTCAPYVGLGGGVTPPYIS